MSVHPLLRTHIKDDRFVSSTDGCNALLTHGSVTSVRTSVTVVSVDLSAISDDLQVDWVKLSVASVDPTVSYPLVSVRGSSSVG